MTWNPGNYPNYISISSYSNLGELSLARQLDARRELMHSLSLDSKLMPIQGMPLHNIDELEKLLKEHNNTVCGLKTKSDGTIGTDDDYERIGTEDDGETLVYRNKIFDRIEKWFIGKQTKELYIRINSSKYVRVERTEEGFKPNPKIQLIKDDDGNWEIKEF